MVSLVIFGIAGSSFLWGVGSCSRPSELRHSGRESTAPDAVVAHRRVTWRGSHRKPRYEREGRACSQVRPAAKRQVEEGTGSPAPSSNALRGRLAGVVVPSPRVQLRPTARRTHDAARVRDG